VGPYAQRPELLPEQRQRPISGASPDTRAIIRYAHRRASSGTAAGITTRPNGQQRSACLIIEVPTRVGRARCETGRSGAPE
jgi:hypothetical protein